MNAAHPVVRSIAAHDGAAYASFLNRLDQETKFLLFEPGERSGDAASYGEQIRLALADPGKVCFVVEAAGEIVGFISATQGAQRRTRHRAYLVMGLLHDYRRRGLGSRLFAAVFAWAEERDLARLELTVATTNAAALALYAKMGFQIEGRRRRSLKIDGQWVDEHEMAKLLP